MTNTAIHPDATAYIADLITTRNTIEADAATRHPNHIMNIAMWNEVSEAADELIEAAFDIAPMTHDNVTIDAAYLTTLAFLVIGAPNADLLNVYAVDPQM